MNKLLALFLLLISTVPIHFSTSKQEIVVQEPRVPEYIQLYEEMNLEGIIDLKAFQQAFEGYNKLDLKNREFLTLIDYTKPSTEERFFVLDLKEKRLVQASHVLHGKNSGYKLPTSFSNEIGSNKSSLGFFMTENTYKGKYGKALVLEGLEKGINDKAKDRAIVIHGSKFASANVINTAKKIPHSLGCPALPYTVTEEVINLIKGGSLVYIYADNNEYENRSKIVTVNEQYAS